MSAGLLADAGFRRLYAAQVASLLGDGMVSVALVFAVLEMGGSATDVGLVLAARIAPLALFLLVGGVIADRRGRRAVMIASDLVRAGSQGASAALVLTGTAEVWSLAALAAAGGAASAFFLPASVALLPSVVDPERLQRANALRGFAMAAGEVAGPLVAGLLVALASPGWALAADAATFAFSAAALAGLAVRERSDASPAASMLADLRAGWRHFRSLRWLWPAVIAAGLSNFLWGASAVLGPVVAQQDLGGAWAWAAIRAGLGAGSVAGALLALRVDPARPMLVASLCFLVFPAPLALLAIPAAAPLVVAGAVAGGLGLMLGNTLWETAQQRHVPGPVLSRVNAYDQLGSLVAYPVGLAAWGPIAAAIGTGEALWLAFALMLAAGAALLAVGDVRRLPRMPEPPR